MSLSDVMLIILELTKWNLYNQSLYNIRNWCPLPKVNPSLGWHVRFNQKNSIQMAQQCITEIVQYYYDFPRKRNSQSGTLHEIGMEFLHLHVFLLLSGEEE